MTAAELLAIIRDDYLDDAVGGTGGVDYNWSDAFLYREIGRAQQEACWRQDLRHFFDTSTSAICQITVAAGTRTYTLDSRILRIHQALLGTVVLEHVTQAHLDERAFDWRGATYGNVKRFFINGRTLFFDYLPTAGTLNLEVWRGPLLGPSEIAASADEELEWTDSQEDLAHWVAFRAFSRREEDAYDPRRAADHRALFDSVFGQEVKPRERLELLRYPDFLSFGPLNQWAQPSATSKSFDYSD